MYLEHSGGVWDGFPALVAGAVFAAGVSGEVDVSARVARFEAVAVERLAAGAVGEFEEVRAWRRTFSAMGLKPTRYRCASEALLRRFAKEGTLPRIHPLIDLCNAVSLAFAIPVAALDTARIAGGLVVRHAAGDEKYETFSGEVEHPAEGEVIFADEAGNAHARRWTNRQSGRSAVRAGTDSVLIVAEAMHGSAAADVPRLMATLTDELTALWPTEPVSALLSRSAPRFEFAATG